MSVNNEPVENDDININVFSETDIIQNPIQNIKKNYDVNLLKDEILFLREEIENKTRENIELKYEMAQKKTNKKKQNGDINEEIEAIINTNSVGYVKSTIFYIKIWNFFTGLFITFKYIILILVVPTLTFASTTYTQYNLNFIAGIFSLTGLAFEKMGKYCEINSKRRVTKLNKILQEHGNINKIQDDSDFDMENKHTDLSDNSPEEAKRSFKLKSTTKLLNQSKSAKNVCVVAFGEDN